jgi:uncharacterized membrane protein (GlpM family)
MDLSRNKMLSLVNENLTGKERKRYSKGMDMAFVVKVALSFLVGSAWVTVSTLAAEKYGSLVGGLVAGLPSTVVVALLFIGLSQSPLAASAATTLIPLTQGINGIFLVAYLILVRKGLEASLLGAMAVWAVQAALLLVIGLKSFLISLAGWLLLAAGCILIVEKAMNIPSRKGIKIRHTTSQIILRALFGGTVIAFAVFMAKAGGPSFGGVFSTFPAMFLSTIIITYRAGGADFSRAVAKSLLISGEVNIVLYAVLARFLYKAWGLALGTSVALAVCLGSGYLLFLYLKSRRD